MRTAGCHDGGFEYSDANRQSGWVWDEARLRSYALVAQALAD